MPWFGVDLLPRRKTTHVMPNRHDQDATRTVVTKQPAREPSIQNSPGKVWSRELHLPSIPAYFDQSLEEELSFREHSPRMDRVPSRGEWPFIRRDVHCPGPGQSNLF